MGLTSGNLKTLAYIPPTGELVFLISSAGVEFKYVGTPVLAAALPAASTALMGARAFVSDATTGTFGATLVGTGALPRPVFCDGTNWLVG